MCKNWPAPEARGLAELTLVLSPNREEGLGERSEILGNTGAGRPQQGRRSGDPVAGGAVGQAPSARRGSIRKKLPPAASQMSKLQEAAARPQKRSDALDGNGDAVSFIGHGLVSRRGLTNSRSEAP